MSLQLVVLGSASQAPSATRNVSSVALRHASGSVWLFDCGEGTQHQVVRQSAVRLSKVRDEPATGAATARGSLRALLGAPQARAEPDVQGSD